MMAQALARLQEAQPTWRKADLIRHLGELLPDDVACRDDAAAAALLIDLADRVLAGGAGERVLTLEAPEWPRVPDSLRRADGRSVYRPHSGTRYTTLAQLTMEERLAGPGAASRARRGLSLTLAARLLGADQAQLEAQLQRRRRTTRDRAAQQTTGSGLRLDQAAAAFLAVTSDRRAEILVGPAGSGKTRTAAQVAELWRQAGLGEVYGLTTSQAARNVLREAGVDLADNTAEFLGHLHGRREARGPKPVRPGTLLLLDEASMMSMADMAASCGWPPNQGCRVLITGDHEQLAAVEGGGGMMMLTRRWVTSSSPSPSGSLSEWERDATLRLRAGDTGVLARIRTSRAGCAAATRSRRWSWPAGRSSPTTSRARTRCCWPAPGSRPGRCPAGSATTCSTTAWSAPAPAVRLRHDAAASPGDLIVARKNDRRIIAGAPGRWLANRDVLRIDGITGPR